MAHQTVNAVIMAGGDGCIIDPEVRIKGLVTIAGKPMVEWVVDTMRAAKTVAEVAVVVPTAEGLGAWAEKVDRIVVSDGSFIENVVAGVDAFGSGRYVVIATGDLPALTTEAVDDYVTRSLEAEADLSYPLVAKAAMEVQFPGSQRTYVKIKNGPVTGGNLMVVTPAIVHRNTEVAQKLFESRKNPLDLARVVGAPFIVKLVSGRLDPEDVARRLSKVFGGRCVALYTEHASIGADVDKPVDVIVTAKVLSEREDKPAALL